MVAFTAEADDVDCWDDWRGPLDIVVDWDGPPREIGIFGGSICDGIVEIGTSDPANQKSIILDVVETKEKSFGLNYLDEENTLVDVEHSTELNLMEQDPVKYDSYLHLNIEGLQYIVFSH